MLPTNDRHPADDPGAVPAAAAAPQQPPGPANQGPAGPTGPAVIAAYVRTLPGSPGVYRMLDAAGEVIYVGKARSLRARVSSYARSTGHANRIQRMIATTASMEFVTVRTEAEALLLEANLIKRFRPRFNVLMRDDKSFPYILIRTDHGSPQILKHRGARTGKGHYFGPFASAGAVARTITMLQRAFLLRTCSDSVFEGRTRPCLLHQIRRCAGPCTSEIAPEEYDQLVAEAVRFLKGESQSVRQMYQGLMEEAAATLEFERAAKFRNRLWALAHVTSEQSINTDGVEEADVFAAVQDGGQTCIQVFFFRSGQNWGNRAYFPKADRSLDAAAVLESFMAQFYDDKPVPKLILASHDFGSRALMEEALGIKAERRVEIRVPQRGAKSDLVEHALSNAKDALGRRMAETSSQRALLAGLADRLGLARPPRRVEVYDNSHIQGTNAIGAMIVAGPDGFAKAHYRKFNMKAEAAPGDDYAMMREMLTRRLKRLAVAVSDPEGAAPVAPLKLQSLPPSGTGFQRAGPLAGFGAEPREGPCEDVSRLEPAAPPPFGARGADAIAFGVLRAGSIPDDVDTTDDGAPEPEMPDAPDLILIDGGAGQLAIAREVLAALGLEGQIPLVGVAKGPDRDAGREHFHLPGRAKSFMLEARDPVLFFIQRLRDEAHRFAIGGHRAKRAKAISANPLDEIGGIGPTRKRALLSHFGSAKSVSRAGVEDLKAVKGISAELAQKIYEFFNERKG